MPSTPGPSNAREYRLRSVCAFCFLFILLFGIPSLGQNPVPFLNQPLVPDAAAPGAAAFTLTVNGTGFVKGSVVNWNGAPLATTLISGSQLMAVVPALNVASNTTATITVSSPAPGGGVSNVEFFVVANLISTVTFTQLPPVTANPPAQALVAADFNGDGILDLAYVTSNNVNVELGNGDGTFQAPWSYSLANPVPFGMVAADFNGDGKLDLAVTSGGILSVFLGNGDGTFQPPLTCPVGPTPWSMAVADFNGDGKLDLAVGSNTLGGGIFIFLGNGDGTFQPYVTYGTSTDTKCPVVGDFNQDGKLDLVYGGQTGLWFLQGNGDGTFQPPVSIPGWLGNNINALVAADLNGDGKLDLIAGENGGGDVQNPPPAGAWVWLGNGDGTFDGPVAYPEGSSYGTETWGLAVADFNADGILDAVVANSTPGYLVDWFYLLLGEGNGAFQNSINMPIPSQYGTATVAGDFNGDGRMDLAFAENFSGQPSPIYVFLQGQLPVASAPNSVSFGQVAVGTTFGPTPVTLTNSGTAALAVTSVAITGADAGDFAETNNCGSSVAPNATCQINVSFTPTASGDLTANLSVVDNATKAPLVIALTGTGFGPTATLSPDSLTFPGQFVGTTGLPQNITLTNNGDAALTITSIKTSAQFQAANGCTSSLAAGVNCTISVFFDPTSAGTQTGTLTITDNAPDSPQTVALSGAGQDFGMSASSSSATVSAGQTANYSISVAPEGGLAQTVSLTCSGAPQLSTCTVSPGSFALNGTASVPVAVAVSTTATTMAPPLGERFPPAVPGRWVLRSFFLLAFVSLAALSVTRRRRALWLAGICLLMMIVWASCGGGSATHTPGTPTGTYTLKVAGTVTSSATSTQLTHTANLTLTVD